VAEDSRCSLSIQLVRDSPASREQNDQKVESQIVRNDGDFLVTEIK